MPPPAAPVVKSFPLEIAPFAAKVREVPVVNAGVAFATNTEPPDAPPVVFMLPS